MMQSNVIFAARCIWKEQNDGRGSKGRPRIRWQDNNVKDAEELLGRNRQLVARDREVSRQRLLQVKLVGGDDDDDGTLLSVVLGQLILQVYVFRKDICSNYLNFLY